MSKAKNIIFAIGGASGSLYAQQFAKLLENDKRVNKVAMIMSPNASGIWKAELNNEEYQNYNFTPYSHNDFYAPIASGSSDFDTMVIIPCSMGQIARISQGISEDLISRAADVILKERKKLVVVPREAPYSLIHLRNMTSLTEAGGIVCPASPSFYSQPNDVTAIVNTIVHRVMDLIDLPVATYRWQQTKL